MQLPDLPITEVLPALLGALKSDGCAVLQAPPGAGKTTVVPLAILPTLETGKIIMLEPRRLAARAAAERMADTLGERIGQTVGYRIKGDTKIGPHTRIEVVTEGILTRMLQTDPMLDGVAAVIFDEFHERSLNADLGLALCWEARNAVRSDLIVLAMSATLDAQPLAEMLGAPIITSTGRAFPVETHWLDTPTSSTTRLEQATRDLVLRALNETEGGVLVFLPGEAEIRRLANLLGDLPASGHAVLPLYGALPFADQRRAIEPMTAARKIVLATSIAETSLTIQDIRVVVDCGLTRRSRFDPGTGMQSLVTERVSKAEAEQRKGRAGRVAHGWCYRLWTRGAEGALTEFAPPEIASGDLTDMALQLSIWGAREDDLAFVTPPSAGGLAAARELLRQLGALDENDHVTPHGKQIAQYPLHARLAHMLAHSGENGAGLAALLSERDPMRDAGADLMVRKRLLGRDGPATLRAETKRLAKMAGPDKGLDWAEMAALAYPDRIGARRSGDAPRYLLSGGRGAQLDTQDALGSADYIVATDLDGKGRDAKIRRALQISESAIRGLYADRIDWHDTVHWSRRERKIVATRQERFGALVLTEKPLPDIPQDQVTNAVIEGIRALGLPRTKKADQLLHRANWLARADKSIPDLTEPALLASLEDWLAPFLVPAPRNADQITGFDITPALKMLLGPAAIQKLDTEVPTHITVPTGRKVAVDYSGDSPEIEIRLQELFGLDRHPLVAGEPLRITMLSPAGRPVQKTTDLPGFWRTTYQDVRKDMRGRYPRHPWPENPLEAAPTTRAKPRKT